MAKYEEINLTIEKKGEKNGKFWIKGSDGEFYGGFCAWEGRSTEAYDEFTDVEEGQNVVITFSKSVGQDDKIYRNVRSIHSSTQKPEKPKVNPLYDKPKEEFKPRNFEQEAYEKCQSLWAAHELGAGVSPDKIVSLHINGGHYWELFQAIKAEGKKQFFEFSLNEAAKNTPNIDLTEQEKANVLGDLPTIQAEQCSNCGQVGATFEDGKHDCIPF